MAKKHDKPSGVVSRKSRDRMCRDGRFRLSRLSAMFTESKNKIQGKDAIPGKILPEKHNR